jgi:CubicO group peptidase (beta-lactamase class C family)
MKRGPLLKYYVVTAVLILMCLLAGHLLGLPRRTDPPAHFPCADPESVGVDPETLKVFSDRVQSLIDKGDAVGAILTIIKDRKVVLHEAFGWADKELERPMKTDTICRLRSMTKPFVGSSILMLAEQGKLALADKVAKYVPSFRNEKCRDITIEQLLTHTGGYEQPGYPEGASAYENLNALVDTIGKVGPTHEPGSRYSYSDAGSSTLAHIVSVASDMPAEEFIRRNILEPLHLKDTDCNMFKDNPLRPRVSSTYRQLGGEWGKYWDNTSRQAVPYFRGSGGMYSTTLDYAKFLEMWMDRGQSEGKKLLSPASVKKALTATALSSGAHGDEGYGYHWQIFRQSDGVFGHGGSDGTIAIASRKENLMFLCFTQTRGGPAVSQLRSLFFDAAAGV